MSRPIDEKLIALKMDNKNFEANAKESLGTFAKMNEAFKKALNIDSKKATNSLKEIDQQSRSINFDSIKNALDTISWRFTNMGIIATTILQNITNKAFNAGASLVKAFTLTPVMDGMKEYELKINSIQTIMSNTKGKATMQDVTDVLDELNTYADKTIYNFAEMTRNIGTFTAAGVDLKDATAAIKGIANLAAASGSSSQQASTAMYQLSQALAAGRVNLMDWNSVVNAGMGGKLFQDALKKTGIAMGKNVTMAENFRNSLQKGWLTTDVLLKTLQEFSVDESMLNAATKVKTYAQLVDTTKEALGSGWAKTWELIVGDFEKARERFTVISNKLNKIIDESSDKRNEFVQRLADLGFGEKVFSIVANAIDTYMSWHTTIKDAFEKMFPPVSAERVVAVLDKINEFVKKISLKPFGDEVTAVEQKFSGMILSSDSHLAGTANWVRNVRTIFEGLFASLSIGWYVIKEVAAAIKELFPGGLITKVIEYAAEFAKIPIEWNNAIKSGERLRDILIDAGNKVKEFFKRAWDGVSKITGPMMSFKDILKSIWEHLKPLLALLKPVLDTIKEFIGAITLQDVLNAGFVGALIMLTKSFKDIFDKFSGLFDKGALDDMAEGFTNMMSTIGESVSGLVGSVKIASLVAISAALLLLVTAIRKLSELDAGQAGAALATLGGALVGLSVSMVALSKIDGSGLKFVAFSTAMIGIATSINILATALKKISDLDPEQMKDDMTTLVSLMMITVGAFAILGNIGGKIQTSALAMIGLATAILILTKAVEKFGKIDSAQIEQGIKALTAIMVVIAAFMLVVNKTTLKPSSAVAVTILAGALMLMTTAVRQIGEMDIEVLKQGLISIAALLAEVAIFSQLVKGGRLMAAGTGVTILAAALTLLIIPVKQLGAMDLGNLQKGLVTLGILMAEVAIFANMMKGTGGAAASLTIIAAALNLLVIPLKVLGSMSLASLAKGLIAMGAALAIVVVAAISLGTVGVAPLLALSAALLGISLSITIAAAGFTLLAAGISSLVNVLASSIVSIVSTIGKLIVAITSLVPQIVTLAVTIVVSLAEGLAEAGPRLFRAGIDLLLGLMKALRDNIHDIVTVAVELVTEFAKGIGDNMGILVDAGVQLIVDFINGLADAVRTKAPDFINAVFNLLEAILELIITVLEKVLIAIFGWIPGVEDGVSSMGDRAKEALRDSFGIDEVANSKIKDTVDTLARNAPAFSREGERLGKSTRDGLGSVKLKGTAEGLSNDALAGLLGRNAIADFKSKGASMGKNVQYGVNSVDIYETGANFSYSFGRGLESALAEVRRKASAIAYATKESIRRNLAIASPSKDGLALGRNFGGSFASGIGDEEDTVWNRSKGLALSAIKAAKDYASSFAETLLGDMTLEPVVKPVLDLDNLPTDWDDWFNPRNGPKPAFATSYMASTLIDSDRRLAQIQSDRNTPKSQNEYKVEVNNRGLLEGSTFVVREEADIEKIAVALDRRTADRLTQKGFRFFK